MSTPWNHRKTHLLLAWLAVAGLGAWEGLLGRTQYLADWISYLNVSQAVSALDWKRVFDPMWSPGYPFLVALVRGLFPHTATGEWYAITLLNWLLFLSTYGIWRFLIREAIQLHAPGLDASADHPVAVWSSGIAFLSFGLCFDRVSRASPDLLVTTLFLLALALVHRLLNRPSLRAAAMLGLALAAGCSAKSVFLAFSCIYLLVLAVAGAARKVPVRILCVAPAVFLLAFIPYVAAISWSNGGFTLGASGELNFAFHVNLLPHWTNWQGGPSQFGRPDHPTTQLLSDLPVFGFGAPFQTTYPPHNNMAYWYHGFRHFYSLRLQTIAVARTLYTLLRIVRLNPILYALLLACGAVALHRDWRVPLLKRLGPTWPLFLPALLGLTTYLLVHVEARYVSPFFLIFSLLPLLPLADRALPAKRLLASLILALYAAGAAAEMLTENAPALRAALHRTDFHSDEQWKLSQALPTYDLKAGDAVALIGSGEPNYLCSWAYVARLRIVAEFGALPWSVAPWDRTPFDHFRPEPADQDFARLFWNLAPDQRERVLVAFRRTGARAVISLSKPEGDPGPGWEPVAGTGAWIHRFASR